MTQEEAIERIKSRYDKWALDDKDLEAIQCAFPELAESEDERIRKFLIDILSSGVWRTEWPFSPVDCVAYLEKQKEQKPAEDWKETRKKECPFRRKLDNNLYGCERYADVVCACDGCCSWVVDYPKLKEIQDRKEQKSAEWSGPKEFISDTISMRLKSLHAQPQQGWSEEDENMLNSCISSIEEAKENRYYYRETDGDTSYDHEISWLKSLRPRPHWTPSEEHLSALLAIINDPNNIGSQTCQLALSDLYEQLKKL